MVTPFHITLVLIPLTLILQEAEAVAVLSLLMQETLILAVLLLDQIQKLTAETSTNASTIY